ncbi:MAG: rhamnulokinase [Victivallaceae bacterium]|nr:rhamnulokinase [Victivallaceae bacterium]
MKKDFLAFDLGASSGRAIVGTFENGNLSLREVHRFPNGPKTVDGALYWDFDALVAELEKGLGKALAVAPQIASIGIDTWGVDYVFFDRTTGKKRRDPFHYRDNRTDKAVPEVHAKISKEKLYERTGIQFMPLNTIYQLQAHLTEHPEDFENSFFLPIPDALGYMLGGDATAEYTDCSTMNLLDPNKRDWAWKLLEDLQFPASVFPKIVPPCSNGGTLAKRLQEKFHCGAIPIVKVGSHDTASAVAAVPVPDTGNWAYLSCGTWALLGAEIDSPILTMEAEKIPFTNEGGLDGKIRFLTNIMGSWLLQETRRTWNEAGKEITFDKMDHMLVEAPAGKYFIDPNNALFAPPGDMPERIREFCRKSGQGTPNDAEVVRCIYDSLALCFATKLAKLGELLNQKYTQLNVVGGGTKAKVLMQVTADALGIPVAAGPVEATAAGNLLAQMIAAGDLADLKAAREVVKRSFELAHYTPDMDMHRQYQSFAPRFLAVGKR